MLQETTAAAGGNNAAQALNNMGFEHLISEMTATPGSYVVSWVVLITLLIMSALAWYWTIINFIKSMRLKAPPSWMTSNFDDSWGVAARAGDEPSSCSLR